MCDTAEVEAEYSPENKEEVNNGQGKGKIALELVFLFVLTGSTERTVTTEVSLSINPREKIGESQPFQEQTLHIYLGQCLPWMGIESRAKHFQVEFYHCGLS
jgi:hypothetical protein